MSNFERFLPVQLMICIGVMLINGFTLPGIACVASVAGYLYLRHFKGG